MRLVTFAADGRSGIGVLDESGSIAPLSHDGDLPTDMVDFVALGAAGLAAAAEVVGSVRPLSPDSVRLLAPIRPRNNVMAVGRNYHDHAKEFTDSGFDASEKKMIPDHPIIFTKAVSSIIGPGDPIDIANDPLDTSDYEGELGVVLGPGGTRITAADAADHVYGYTIVNDVTARELQKRHVQFFIGKSAATYCPMGPCIVTADEVEDITQAVLRTRVNGELRQEAAISQLIFDIPALIEAISAAVLIEPGDVIATGTPAGVGIGRLPPVYLAAGDVVEVSIDGIGTLVNSVVRS